MNKKVVNATAVFRDNIKFRSKAEAKMYELLKESGSGLNMNQTL